MSEKRTVSLRYPVRVIVTLELRVDIPLDEDGEPDVEEWEIKSARETPISTVSHSDVTEAIASDSGELEAFAEALREALAKSQDD
jgi:hypothetical protein